MKAFSSKRKERRKKIEDAKWRDQAHKRALQPWRLTLQVKTFSFNEKETTEDPEWGEQAHKDVPSTSKIKLSSQDLLFQREESIWRNPGEENKHQIVPSIPKTGLSSQRSRLSSRKSISQDGDRIRGLYICSFVTNIRDCTQILLNTIQISFVHNFVITNFGTLGGTISTFHLFFQN